MNSFKLREEFLKFFKEKGHKIVSSSSLIPEDKTVLLTSAGMQQFVPYLSGEKEISGARHLASIQKCFRTPDIEEVGDDTHHTFFEMLGNWSIGEDEKKGYFKEGAIELALQFFVDRLGLDKNKIWATIFKGEERDDESFLIWQKMGIPKERILEFGWEDNFWGPTSSTGPCGPSSEIHYDRGEEYGCKSPSCGVGCDNCRRFVELWNLVFMEYNKNEDGSYSKLPQRNVDTGIGFERLVSLMQGKDSAYETDLFYPVIRKIEEISSKGYKENKKAFRIICDHIRGAIFLISDGVLPSNTERGYILRRILRRMIRVGRSINLQENFSSLLVGEVVEIYGKIYPEIAKEEITSVIKEEEKKFNKTLDAGLSELKNISSKEDLGKKLFFIYQSYGLPLELSLEELSKKDGNILSLKKEIEDSFRKEFEKHQEVSRSGAERKFGGLSDKDDYEVVKLHTATHLLHQALREVLGSHVKQMGSDIIKERLRFDFSHPSKLREEEIEKIERIVNLKIKEGLEVKKEEMSLEMAMGSGALAFFKEKYKDNVCVYSVGSFSKEVCGGPHVRNTSELGVFKIKKEESAGAGIRRIRAVLK